MLMDTLRSITQRFGELDEQIADPALISQQEEWQKLVKERAELEPIVTLYGEYMAAEQAVKDSEEMMAEEDAEIRELAQQEKEAALERMDALEGELRLLLLPKDPNDSKDIVMELRAGTGGEEAALFAGDLLRMYLRYAERHRLKTELLYSNETELGGIKEAELSIAGRDAYSKLKYESGAHRVQRVPVTESQGRIQTSAATVVVMPEVDDVQIEIRPEDLRIDTYRASGAGGQHVNTTDSAIRITHVPTGIVAQCMDERSQHKNKDKAMRVLKARLYDHYESQQRREQAATRKSMVGSGDRSERIRTYNFPQGRVTDHRIGVTLYKLNAFLDGDMDEMLDALALSDKSEQLMQLAEGR